MEGAWVALALTLKVALWATALNLVLGVAIGYALARWRFAGRELLDAVFTLPMVMPPTVLGYYLLVLVGTHSPIGAWLLDHLGIRLIFTWQGAVLAAMVVSFPLVFKGARAAFETVDPQLEDAARTLGIHEVAVFFRISLPMAWPACCCRSRVRSASSAPR
jgi:molybdate transport system permease protein